ncbi:hypothetical protein HBN50_07940 [Halobacteriovorax sp. GB3]|uniref:hypothetical protein n=1 Tax=Halobacteriovorax sp. GB3 TaxID=2719615 RepID=UPI00235DC3D2|nr:hypothetical protein [Halobacteriovorax sp. GB3]MDD0853023.1 hypothetical protein [Halobacteriovorax sp. GB3]
MNDKILGFATDALRDLSLHYTKAVAEKTICNYANILSQDFSPSVIKKACDSIKVNAGSHFPSIAEFKSIAINFVPKDKTPEYQNEVTRLSQWKKEEMDLQKIRNMLKNKLGDKSQSFLKDYMSSYCEHVFNLTPESCKDLGISLSLFEKPALIDLRDANFQPKEAIKIGIKKHQEKSTKDIA